MCENVAPDICQKRTKCYKDHWKKMMGDSAAIFSHNGTKQSAREAECKGRGGGFGRHRVSS